VDMVYLLGLVAAQVLLAMEEQRLIQFIIMLLTRGSEINSAGDIKECRGTKFCAPTILCPYINYHISRNITEKFVIISKTRLTCKDFF